MMDKGKAITALKERMSSVTPLVDEPEYTVSDETIVRFLKACEWKMKDAEKALLNTVEYRRQTRPLTQDCHWCRDRPGFHSMRQIGHDESGRPVVYANFCQASVRKNNAEDIIGHVTYLIENAKATMENGVTTWVFVIDCTDMTLSACNPKLGYSVSNILSSHYPERLGLVICVNHNSLFHGVWKALKKLLSPGTVAKVKLARTDSKIQQLFSNYFSEELTTWLMDEIALNRQKPLPMGQREFWNPPANPQAHDARGCSSYVQHYVLPVQHQDLKFVPGQKKLHCPHPNIIDALRSKVVALPSSLTESEDIYADEESASFNTGEGLSNFDNDLSSSDDDSTEAEDTIQTASPGGKKSAKVGIQNLVIR
ncbi:hypothetical protein BsWGS_16477 [Bradybaena similaris]